MKIDDLEPGLVWGRHWYLEREKKKWTNWAVVEVWGNRPFFRGEIRYIPHTYPNMENPHLNIENHLDKWVFGPKLNIPSREPE